MSFSIQNQCFESEFNFIILHKVSTAPEKTSLSLRRSSPPWIRTKTNKSRTSIIFIISDKFLLKSRFECTFSRFCSKKYKIFVSKGTPSFWPPPLTPPSFCPAPPLFPAWPHASPLLTFDKKFNLFTAKFYDLDAILIVFSSKFERNNLLIFSHFLYCWLVEPWWQAWPRWDYRHAREDSGYWLCFRMRRDQAQTIRGGWRKLPHKHFIKKIIFLINSEVARDAILIFNFCFYVNNFSSTKSYFFLFYLGPHHFRGSGYRQGWFHFKGRIQRFPQEVRGQVIKPLVLTRVHWQQQTFFEN